MDGITPTKLGPQSGAKKTPVQTRSPKYLLVPDVRICFTSDWPVLFDLNTGSYRGLTTAQQAILRAHVQGWPQSPVSVSESQSESPDEQTAERLLRQMVRLKILTTDATIGKPIALISQPQIRTYLQEGLEARPLPKPHDIFRFYYAVIRAKVLLRSAHSMRPLSTYVIDRRQRFRTKESADPERTRELLLSFTTLRPLLFNTKTSCLLDTLALIEFLLPEGIFPTWVFGVRTRPFFTHSWLRYGQYILDDNPDHVRAYTPIAEF